MISRAVPKPVDFPFPALLFPVIVRAMTDEELLDNALPWIEELLRRNMLGVQVRIPSTAVTPAKIVYAWPEYSDHHVLKDQLLLFVSDWSVEEPVNDLRTLSVANTSKPRPVSKR